MSAQIGPMSAYYLARLPGRRDLADPKNACGQAGTREEPLRDSRASSTISACLQRDPIERQPFSSERPARCQEARRVPYPRRDGNRSSFRAGRLLPRPPGTGIHRRRAESRRIQLLPRRRQLPRLPKYVNYITYIAWRF